MRPTPGRRVIVQTGELTWIVAVVEKSLEQLIISPASGFTLIIKARSCQILEPSSCPLNEIETLPATP